MILNRGEDTDIEDDLIEDVLETFAVLSARLSGGRRNQNCRAT